MSEYDDFLRQVADQVLDGDTAAHVEEQKSALKNNPEWAAGYYHLAQLYRVQHKRDEAKRNLLIALEKQPSLSEAHVALGEIYIAEGDLDRARQHAEFAAALGHTRLLEQMKRNGAY